jgi:hypothetical protein
MKLTQFAVDESPHNRDGLMLHGWDGDRIWDLADFRVSHLEAALAAGEVPLASRKRSATSVP